jgi:co-chaperonin GroES (HSP10)
MLEFKSIEDIIPINSQLLIKNDSIEDDESYTTKSGIIVSNPVDLRNKGRSVKATVIKVGSVLYDKQGNSYDLKSMYSEGDRILYYAPAGSVKIKIAGEEYILLRAEDVDIKFED